MFPGVECGRGMCCVPDGLGGRAVAEVVRLVVGGRARRWKAEDLVLEKYGGNGGTSM